MNIALDYDDTFTRDPALWGLFALAARERGHDIRIVTFRTDDYHNDDLKGLLHAVSCDWIPVIYTRANRKRDWCVRNHGWTPHIWIDDMPELIVGDDTYVPGEMLARQTASQGNK